MALRGKAPFFLQLGSEWKYLLAFIGTPLRTPDLPSYLPPSPALPTVGEVGDVRANCAPLGSCAGSLAECLSQRRENIFIERMNGCSEQW
jgi:hypothetical protein